MKRSTLVILVGAFALGCGWAVSMRAYQPQAAPAPAAQAAAAPTGQASLASDATCTVCHNAASGHVTEIYESRHGVKGDSRTPGCTSCHGPSDAHLKDPTGTPPTVVFAAKSKHLSPAAVRNTQCLSCHAKSVLPRTNWAGSQHETRGVACTDCHNIHSSDQKVLSKATQADVCFKCHQTQRAEVRHVSAHPLAKTGTGEPPQMSCSDCHNVHGSTGPTLLRKNSVNETCYTCHAEKRGPFLWEHAPVVESCTTCHKPHGSVNPSLLKARTPFLCQECHSGDHGAQVNSGANLAGGGVTTTNGILPAGAGGAAPRAQLAARACLNCHVLIHGSNHPAGAKFQR